MSKVDINTANVVHPDRSSEQSFTLEDIATERGKMAAEHINLICASTVQCPESRALFYDELAAALALKSSSQDVLIDHTFSVWLSEFITHLFTSCYTTDEGSESDLIE